MICLYLGSFNPVHWGHLTLGHYAYERLGCNEIWFLLSPLNPQKKYSEQWSYTQRRDLLLKAIEPYNYMRLCQIERSMLQPYYTWRTLRAIKLLYPQEEFILLIGGDNLNTFKSWYKWKEILGLVHLYVYPRPNYPLFQDALDGFAYNICQDTELCDVSSTQIRQGCSVSLV